MWRQDSTLTRLSFQRRGALGVHFGPLGSSLGASGLQFELIMSPWGALWVSLGVFGELGAPFWDPRLHLEALRAPFSNPKSIVFKVLIQSRFRMGFLRLPKRSFGEN